MNRKSASVQKPKSSCKLRRPCYLFSLSTQAIFIPRQTCKPGHSDEQIHGDAHTYEVRKKHVNISKQVVRKYSTDTSGTSTTPASSFSFWSSLIFLRHLICSATCNISPSLLTSLLLSVTNVRSSLFRTNFRVQSSASNPTNLANFWLFLLPLGPSLVEAPLCSHPEEWILPSWLP